MAHHARNVPSFVSEFAARHGSVIFRAIFVLDSEPEHQRLYSAIFIVDLQSGYLCCTVFGSISEKVKIEFCVDDLDHIANSSIAFICRTISTIAERRNLFNPTDLIPLSVPLVMLVFGTTNVWIVSKVWLQIILTASFFFGAIGLNAGHHHPDIVHDGDKLRF